ncbi:MAG: hypothetical protein ACYCVD_04220 [Desulfitobacteriaceae bacterium]
MAQDRILGSSASIDVYGPNGPVPYGELDSFDANPEHELKKFHPLGQKEEHGQMIYKGYTLSFKGAKVNGDWDKIQAALDSALLAGQPAPLYRITEITILNDGTVEIWIYDNAILYGLKTNKDNAEDEIKQEMSGWAPKRVKG